MSGWLLRACLLAFPRARRRDQGQAVLDLAEELVAGGASPWREALGLVGAGLAARFELTGVPWPAALQRLALPLAALLLAAMVCGTGLDFFGGNWLGWTSGLGVAGGGAAAVGLAFGRRRLAIPGAALVLAVCCVDGLRDQYGSGSRWVALAVDVLPALLPAACVLLACAFVPRRRRLAHGIGALAWTLAGASALVVLAVVARENTTTGTTVLAAGAALAGWFTVSAVCAGDGARRAAGALALAAASPAALWSLAAAGPFADVAHVVLVGGGLLSGAAVLRLTRASTATAAR